MLPRICRFPKSSLELGLFAGLASLPLVGCPDPLPPAHQGGFQQNASWCFDSAGGLLLYHDLVTWDCPSNCDILTATITMLRANPPPGC